MWPKSYKDYPSDQPLIREPLYPGKGIIGCEMHDLNGWGTECHRAAKKKKQGGKSWKDSFLAIFKRKAKDENASAS